MWLSPTKFARAGELNIAYRTGGSGPIDLVVAPGWVSNVEMVEDRPGVDSFFKSLADFSRLILFDKRGTGCSDRNVGFPTLEERMDDLRAVLDAVGSKRAVVFGVSEGGSMAILFAATHQDRTRSLVTFGAFARRIRSEDYPWAPTPEERAEWIESIRTDWGGEMDIATLAPSLTDEASRHDLARYFRMSASPAMAVQLAELNTYIDVRAVLPAIRVPTLVVHREGDRDSNVEEGAYIASRIRGSKFIRLKGDDHLPFVGDSESVVSAIREFVTGAKAPVHVDRVLTTVLFTDIVESTRRAREMGDAKWLEILRGHQKVAELEVERHRGRLIKFTGDGILATFDGPARAIRCAHAIQTSVPGLGIQIRAGVHTGEVELLDSDIGGIAVHTAARIMSEAGPGEVFSSEVVRDLSIGSGIEFIPNREVNLKGLSGPTRLLTTSI